MDYGDMRGGGCSASGVCAAPRCCYVLLWLSLLLMFCTLCSSVTYYILTYLYYIVQEKSLRGHRGSCRGCWRKSRRRRRSHSW